MKTNKVFAKELSEALIENKMESPMLLDILNKFIESVDEQNFIIGFGENEKADSVLFIEFSQVSVILEDLGDELTVSLSNLIDKEVIEVMRVNMTDKLREGLWSKYTQAMSAYIKIILAVDEIADITGFDIKELHEYITNTLMSED